MVLYMLRTLALLFLWNTFLHHLSGKVTGRVHAERRKHWNSDPHSNFSLRRFYQVCDLKLATTMIVIANVAVVWEAITNNFRGPKFYKLSQGWRIFPDPFQEWCVLHLYNNPSSHLIHVYIIIFLHFTVFRIHFLFVKSHQHEDSH